MGRLPVFVTLSRISLNVNKMYVLNISAAFVAKNNLWAESPI